MPVDRDEELVEELRRVAGAVDAVPPHVVAAAQAAIGWRTIDDELAELLHDSSSEPTLAGVRADEATRVLSFAGERVSVEVEVSGSGPARTLIGQLAPARPGRIEIRHADGVTTVTADERGRFSAADVPAGNVSLRCMLDAAGESRALTTPWLPI
jgi:hypothetical protein